jgi:hypothetical protein
VLGPIRSLLGLFREGAQRQVIRAASLRSSIGHVDRPYLLFEAGVDFNSFIYIVSISGILILGTDIWQLVWCLGQSLETKVLMMMELLKSALWAVPVLLVCFKAREECTGNGGVLKPSASLWRQCECRMLICGLFRVFLLSQEMESPHH